MTARSCVLLVVIVAASPLARGNDPIQMQLQQPLAALPLELLNWRGIDEPPVEPAVAKVLGADDYLNRTYADDRGNAVGLWVSFYTLQRQGDAIHSPLNCLPGTGWAPVAHSRRTLQVGNRRLPVNRYVVQKRGDRQLVTYWFQGRDRVVASEYANKAYLLIDALRLRRTDGALVRVVTALRRDERAADATTARFIAAFQPQLTRLLP